MKTCPLHARFFTLASGFSLLTYRYICFGWLYYFHTIKLSHIIQECIPVGCVPAARRPYGAVCSGGGVWSGGCLLPGGCLLLGGSGPGGSGLGGGGGVCSWGGVCSQGVSQHALRQTPSPRGQNS